MSKEAKRAARHRAFDRARRLYRLLIRIVGGANPVCKWCGKSEHETQLQLDHVQGKSWRSNKLRMDARINRMRDELKRGVKFRILCIECNSKDGRARQLEGRVHAEDAAMTVRLERKLEEQRGKKLSGGEVDGLFDTVPF